MSTPIFDTAQHLAMPAGRTDAAHAVPRGARPAVLTAFLVLGITTGNWVVRIPAVQDKLELSNTQLGLTLLGMPFGALLAMPLAGWLVARIGSRRVTRVCTLAVCVTVPLLALAPHPVLLGVALALFGASSGALDVGMNAQGVAVEQRYGRSLMSSFHAAFSGGAMAGSATGGLAAAADVPLFLHLLVVSVIMGGLAAVVQRLLLPSDVDTVAVEDRPALIARVPGPVLALGIIGFCALLAEGAMADWTAVYLRREAGTTEGFAAAGFFVFSLTMAAGRLGGDWLLDRVAPDLIVRLGGALSCIGLALGLLADVPAALLLGFALVGVGLSVTVPIVFGAAGRVPGVPAGQAIAAVTTASYVGFLLGPPLIGLVARWLSLRGGLGLVVLLLLVMTLLAPAARREPT